MHGKNILRPKVYLVRRNGMTILIILSFYQNCVDDSTLKPIGEALFKGNENLSMIIYLTDRILIFRGVRDRRMHLFPLLLVKLGLLSVTRPSYLSCFSTPRKNDSLFLFMSFEYLMIRIIHQNVM
jgi:hypothetical protein